MSTVDWGGGGGFGIDSEYTDGAGIWRVNK
jgi:hypothetical protein